MNSRISSYFFFVLLLCAFIAAVFIFLPFLTPIILGATTAVLAYPLYRLFCRMFARGKDRSNIAAFLTTVIVLIVVIVPIFFLAANVYAEIQSLYVSLTDEGGRSGVVSSLNSLSVTLSHFMFDAFPAYTFDSFNVTEYLKKILEWAFANLDNIFGGLARVAGYAFVFLLSIFYFLRDGAIFKRHFVSWSPLLDTHDEYVSSTLKKAVSSVFVGFLIVGVVQGILTGLGFYLFGIPAPSIWGSLAAVASLVPGLGTSLVIVPGIIYLLVTGQYLYAIGLSVWGVFAVGLIDNFLGPHLIHKGIDVHPFIILVSVLGGIAVFGPIGFVLGPLILALLFALLELYKTSFSQQQVNNTN
ncbi:MAG: AI-2E family transporter [Candidatus Paceibacterota bacterium]|jgi:predicted PurR-regulated permease PerM